MWAITLRRCLWACIAPVLLFPMLLLRYELLGEPQKGGRPDTHNARDTATLHFQHSARDTNVTDAAHNEWFRAGMSIAKKILATSDLSRPGLERQLAAHIKLQKNLHEQFDSGAGPGDRSLSCSLNGGLTATMTCACDPPWIGPECSQLDVLPRRRRQLLPAYGSDASVSWGGNALKRDDGAG